jgi:hypothetical protein
MLGAALEAMLLAMCSLYLDEVDSIVTQRHLKVPRSLDQWNLGHMLMIAREMKWLPSRSSPRAQRKVGDYAGVLKDVRNFVHPGAHLRRYPTGRLMAEDFHIMNEILEGAIGWLRHRGKGEPAGRDLQTKGRKSETDSTVMVAMNALRPAR